MAPMGAQVFEQEISLDMYRMYTAKAGSLLYNSTVQAVMYISLDAGASL